MISYHSIDPILRPYPVVYPYFDLYLPKSPAEAPLQITELIVLPPFRSAHRTSDNRTSSRFSFLCVSLRYTDHAAYPHISLYPPVAGQVNLERLNVAQGESVSRYPYLQICEIMQLDV